MRILGRTSSVNVRKVLWTADEIGLSYDHEDQWATHAAPSTAPDFLALNPNGLVPVIQDEAGVLWESNAICRYLAVKHGRSDLLPSDPFGRAQVEKWMDWQVGDLTAAWRYAFLALVRRAKGYDDAGRVERSIQAWNRLMVLLDAHLASAEGYAAGPSFTLADIVLGLSIHRWRSTPIDHAAAPAIAAYMLRLSERPAFARYAAARYP
jgi:glutathione S-transferase